MHSSVRRSEYRPAVSDRGSRAGIRKGDCKESLRCAACLLRPTRAAIGGAKDDSTEANGNSRIGMSEGYRCETVRYSAFLLRPRRSTICRAKDCAAITGSCSRARIAEAHCPERVALRQGILPVPAALCIAARSLFEKRKQQDGGNREQGFH